MPRKEQDWGLRDYRRKLATWQSLTHDVLWVVQMLKLTMATVLLPPDLILVKITRKRDRTKMFIFMLIIFQQEKYFPESNFPRNSKLPLAFHKVVTAKMPLENYAIIFPPFLEFLLFQKGNAY